VTRAQLDKRPADVAAMFDAVARRYDLTNDVLSLGQDRRWRRLVVDAVDPRPGERVLDLAAGTGTSSEPFAARGAQVVPCDFSLGMLAVGKRERPALGFTAGDGTRLPFADAAFDAVTISFGLRNVADVHQALTELHRVTRPGGKLVILETSQPVARPLRAMNRVYTDRVMPLLARLFSSDPSSYAYLAESAGTWLDQQALADALRAAGWTGVGWRDLLFGAVAIHSAVRPEG
jgi:demethylmenaquinone methyltransferase / 2-methoxy-6-polyprenyl-1,4-benzoquinol methylase